MSTHIPVHDDFVGVKPGSRSVIVPVSFFFCRCPTEWLTGAHATKTLARFWEAVERSGFPVVDGSVEYFGTTQGERDSYGATLNLILQDSGISFDCYPPDRFNTVPAVQMNLHYCNISHDNDHKVGPCIAGIEAILRPAKPPIIYRRVVMSLDYESAIKDTDVVSC